jgi:tetratricopeptide (TPR) repeat protein
MQMLIIRRKKHPEFYNRRGYLKYHRNELRGAIRDFDEAIRLAPNYGTAYHNRGFTKLKLSEIQDDYGRIFNDAHKDLITSTIFPSGEGDYAM